MKLKLAFPSLEIYDAETGEHIARMHAPVRGFTFETERLRMKALGEQICKAFNFWDEKNRDPKPEVKED